MKFEKKLKLRLGSNIVLLVLGIVSIMLGIIKIYFVNDSKFTSYYISTGAGLIFSSIRKLKQTMSALSNNKKMEDLRIEENDEWNILVRYKSAYFAVASTIISSYTLSLVFLFTNSDLFMPFITVNSILVAFFLFFMFILRKPK